MLSLEQVIIRKRQIENMAKLDIGNSKAYKREAISDIEVYDKELKAYLLSGFYDHMLWKAYPKEKNT